jgi:single-strand DNA-binding protein
MELNKVFLAGRIGKTPIIENFDNFSVCRLNLATHWKNKDKQEQTEWHRVVFFNQLADIVSQYCKTGDSIFIEGYLKTRMWLDTNAVNHYTTEIVGQKMQFISTKKETQTPPPENPTTQPPLQTDAERYRLYYGATDNNDTSDVVF